MILHSRPIQSWIGYVLLFGFFVWLSLWNHSKSGIFNYHSEIWADKAGYYVYLPATFIYDWDASKMPDSLAMRTGEGFKELPADNKIFTKYPYGVALLQTPFWLAAYAINGADSTGFEPIFHKSVDVAAVFYLVCSIFLLLRLLRRFGSNGSLAVGLVLLGTNLLYYSVGETGMSHVFSFFAFSLFLYGITHPDFGVAHRPTILTALAIALIVVVRPMNVLFAVPIFFYFQRFNFAKYLLLTLYAVPLGALLVLPQLMYYNYITGSLVSYSYQNEGFIYWNAPRVLEVLFAPNNGLFAYSPLLLVYVLMALPQWRTHGIQLAMLGLYVYLYASWHSYMLGCGFGHRAIIDLLPLLSIGVVRVIDSYRNLHGAFVALVAALVVLNIRLTFVYDTCFYGKMDWDWAWYLGFVFKL